MNPATDSYPQATELVVIRHGETEWNRALRIQGHTDIDLSPRGREQAHQLALRLSEEPFAAVYSSDLQRALQTAQAVSANRGFAVQVEPLLRERCFGVFEGLTHTQIEQDWPQAAQHWRTRDAHFSPEGGESLSAFNQRCLAALYQLAQRHTGQRIALVAHGGVLDCWYRAATGQSLQAPRTWRLGNASINRLLWHPQGLSLVGWSDEHHLQGLSSSAH